MVSSVYWEWELLLQAIKLGIKLAFIYDVIRIFRIMLSHKNIVVSLEDLFFWTYAAMIIFELQLELSDGVLRGFSILGMLLGMYLYGKILGERLIWMAEKGKALLVSFLGKNIVLKRLLTKIRKVFKINLCRQRDVSKSYRRKHGKKEENKKRKETEQAGSCSGCNGSSGDACGSGRK